MKASIWVQAQLRLCDGACLAAAVARRGDPDAGSVLLRLNRLNGTSDLFVPVTGDDGARRWMRAGGPEAIPDQAAEAYIRRQVDIDPDLWVLEIEDPKGRYALDHPVF
ncbi:MAG: DUF1491 family protein [Magnetospirillum sp. WYHS-4]